MSYFLNFKPYFKVLEGKMIFLATPHNEAKILLKIPCTNMDISHKKMVVKDREHRQ